MAFQIELETCENENILETSECRKTSEHMTRYEYTRLLAARTLQISNGYPPTINTDGIYDAEEIAKMELHARSIPLIIRRTLHDGTKETWNVKDMHIRDY